MRKLLGLLCCVWKCLSRIWRAFIHRSEVNTSVATRLFIRQPLNGLFFKPMEFLHSPPPPPVSRSQKKDKAQFSPSTAGRPQPVFQPSLLSRFRSSIVKECFGQRGCGEVGIKWGSESTVGQSTGALSGLSISLTPTPPRHTHSVLSLRVG